MSRSTRPRDVPCQFCEERALYERLVQRAETEAQSDAALRGLAECDVDREDAWIETLIRRRQRCS